MYSKILLAVDGSANNMCAVLDCIELASKHESTITAIYVVDEGLKNIPMRGATGDIKPSLIETGEKALGEVKRDAMLKNVKVETVMKEGHPVDVIVEESKKYDLVVCGSLGLTGIAKALIGSVSENIVRKAHCPVLVCRVKN